MLGVRLAVGLNRGRLQLRASRKPRVHPSPRNRTNGLCMPRGLRRRRALALLVPPRRRLAALLRAHRRHVRRHPVRLAWTTGAAHQRHLRRSRLAHVRLQPRRASVKSAKRQRSALASSLIVPMPAVRAMPGKPRAPLAQRCIKARWGHLSAGLPACSARPRRGLWRQS